MWGFLAFNQFTLEAGFGTGIWAYKKKLNTREEEGLISKVFWIYSIGFSLKTKKRSPANRGASS